MIIFELLGDWNGSKDYNHYGVGGNIQYTMVRKSQNRQLATRRFQ